MALSHAHAGLTVENMDRALALYRDFLGMEVIHVAGQRADDPANIGTHLAGTSVEVRLLRLGDFQLELVDYGNAKERNFDMDPRHLGGCHVAFFCSDVQAEYDRMRSMGFWFRSEPQGSSQISYGRDRDGHWIELCREHGSGGLFGRLSHGHCGRTVEDLDRAVWFYRDLLGMDVVWEVEGGQSTLGNMTVRVAWVQMGGFRIELVDYGNLKERPFDMDPRDLGGTHLAFFCDDVQEEYDRLRSAGIWFRSPPVDWGPGKPTTTCGRDPEGHWFELTSRHELQA